MACFAKFLMCVLAPVRIFSGDCFLGVRGNSVCGALSVRSGLDHLRIWTEILEFCCGFKLGIAEQIPRIVRRGLFARDADARRIVSSRLESGLVTGSIPRRVAGKLGPPPFRSDCASQNFSIIVTKKRSTQFYEIQGPVCVDGLVLWARFKSHCATRRPARTTVYRFQTTCISCPAPASLTSVTKSRISGTL
jgi:hypothetical protein